VYQADHPYSVQEQVSIPELLTMTAFPNPVNGAATVRLCLPEQLSGELGVYDAVGRRITTLATGSFAAGSHNYWINGSNFPSGVYHVRFQNDASSQLVRLMIVR
ncbi:MAG: T9SS type A sorting domain-containing protein, partial [Candidatus Electryoneaceae bacterium]|nr:T9SS type A sorting domain-containing protein [Candidatus Electryoneaceae bacterium]